MKYAFKSYRSHPNPPQGVNLDSVWMKIAIEDVAESSYVQDGWTIKTEEYLENNLLIQPPAIVPQVITPTQAKRALLRYGLDETAILAMLNQLPTENFLRADAIIMWKDSKEFQRNNPTVLMMAQAMGWTSEQLDQLWILGSTL